MSRELRLRLKWMCIYFAVLLLVLAILYTFSLLFPQTGYGLTRLHDLGVSTI